MLHWVRNIEQCWVLKKVLSPRNPVFSHFPYGKHREVGQYFPWASKVSLDKVQSQFINQSFNKCLARDRCTFSLPAVPTMYHSVPCCFSFVSFEYPVSVWVLLNQPKPLMVQLLESAARCSTASPSVPSRVMLRDRPVGVTICRAGLQPGAVACPLHDASPDHPFPSALSTGGLAFTKAVVWGFPELTDRMSSAFLLHQKIRSVLNHRNKTPGSQENFDLTNNRTYWLEAAAHN